MMKYIKLFEQFKENDSAINKVYLATKRSSGQAYLSYKGFAGDKFFVQITENNIDSIEINPDYPILNYQSDIINQLLKERRINSSNIYNHPKDIKISGSKKDFHELIGDDENIPKTVFTKQEALKLRFPVIAKPSKGHSGLGIEIIKTPKLLKKLNESDFDIFSEFINKKEEQRFFMFKGTPIVWLQRDPVNDKAKTGDGDKSEEMNFNYTRKLVENIPKDYLKVLQKFSEKFKALPFICFDMMKDQDGKVYVIESNSQPGVPFDSIVELYKFIYEDFFKKTIDRKSLIKLNDYSSDLIKKTIKKDPKRFSSDK